MGSEKAEPRKAILLAAFGTSDPEAAKALDGMEKRARAAHPGVEVRWAYTSSTIRARLAKEGKASDSPGTALSRLRDDQYTHVAILPFHVVPGVEFHELARDVRRFRESGRGFTGLALARPLIASHGDLIRVVDLMLHRYAGRLGREEAVVLMGHGNGNHASDAIYIAAHYMFKERAGNCFLGALRGYPTLKDLLPGIRASGAKKVHLIPFMSFAGGHVRKDMAGEGPESWKSVLEANGMETEAVYTGLAQYPEVAAIWLDHLQEAFSTL